MRTRTFPDFPYRFLAGMEEVRGIEVGAALLVPGFYQRGVMVMRRLS